MDNMVRVALALPSIKPGLIDHNAKNMLKLMSNLHSKQPHLTIFPAYALTGASCGFMFKSRNIVDRVKTAIEDFAEATVSVKDFILFGVPKPDGDSVAVVLFGGKIIKIIEAKDFETEEAIIRRGNFSFAVHLGTGKELMRKKAPAVDMVISLSAEPCRVGTVKKEKEYYKAYARANHIAVAASNGNDGETTSPYYYSPFATVIECGEVLYETLEDENSITADVDLDIVKSDKSVAFKSEMVGAEEKYSTSFDFFRHPKCNPFLPTDIARRRLALDEMFDFQVKSLSGRMNASGIKKLVVGVSGGVDSTIALMVAVKALDELSLSRTNLIGITMPGFGTNDRTYYNALKLIVGFKAELREIPIKNAVLQHFEDIKHDASNHNSTYENAQARERAQILLDIANSENALVIGTGDLSECALGFFTYSGDQVAHFNVNESIPKTIVREIINRQMTLAPFEPEADLLSDIVLTPVSPELIPSVEKDFAQQTEHIIGPYELHDFFIYYYVKYGFAPKKLYEYACHSFFGIYDKKEILSTIKIFYKRFIENQFKRSFNPDGASFGEVSLASCDFIFPSDMDSSSILSELDKIKVN